MRRVVITGMGIVSCLGNNVQANLESLKNGKSGITANETYKEMGFRSQVSGTIDIDFKDFIDRKQLRFMGDAAGYTYIALQEAIAMAGLDDSDVSNVRTGIIAGSGGASSANIVETADTARERGIKRVGPYRVTQTMSSTISACLATPFKIKGVNYSLSSACATSAHCIGNGVEQIQMGKQDIIFAGGGEEEHWSLSAMFDAMGAMSSKYNDTPEKASRPYDADRDGFVISCGAGMVVLEELEHAKARGANILAEVIGYGATSDGYDMVAPSGEGALRSMQQALANVEGDIDYVNTHGTSTPAGDIQELNGIRAAFEGKTIPPVASTKSLSGHSLGATGAHEAIYSLLMMQNNFIAASANIENLDPGVEDTDVVQTRRDGVQLNTIMSNSFGFGGTNATLVLRKWA